MKNTHPTHARSPLQVLLYYALQENECDANTYCAFRAVDPAHSLDDDAIAAHLAAQLDTEPGNDDFQMRSMYIDLPEDLVARIREEAIRSFLSVETEAIRDVARQITEQAPELASEIRHQMNHTNMCEDISAMIMQDCNADNLSDDAIHNIARNASDKLNKDEAYTESYWNALRDAIDEAIEAAERENRYGGRSESGRVFYHITKLENISSINMHGLLPSRSPCSVTKEPKLYLLTDIDTLEDSLLNWADQKFDDDSPLAIVRVELPDDFPLKHQPLMPCEKISTEPIPPEYLSFYTEEGAPLAPVGRLDFYYRDCQGNGKICESIDYYAKDRLIADAKAELDSGAALGIVLYRDKDGCTLSRSFLLEMDTLPLSVTVEDPPAT